MLTLNWGIFWIVFNIIVLFILLRIFLFKPLNKLAAKRTALIEGQIEEADTKNKEAARSDVRPPGGRCAVSHLLNIRIRG